MQITAWYFLLLLALHGVPEPVQLEAPDPAFVQRLDWAQSQLSQAQVCGFRADCDDVIINALALSSLGRFDLARPALVRVPAHTPLWVLGSYDYWTRSGDDAFVREQWTFIANALFADTRGAYDGGVLLGAIAGVIDMARVRQDSAALERAAAMVSAAEQRAQQHPGLFAPVLGLLDDDLEEAHLHLLTDSIYPQWPLATGLLALALYRYHRAADAFVLMQGMARRETSTAAMFVLPLMRGLVGWDVDAPRRAVAIEPHLPESWSELRVRNLNTGRQLVHVAITHERGSYTIQLGQDGTAPLSVRVSPALPAGARITSVLVNDADQAAQIESNPHDTHVVIETTLRRATNIEIEYQLPRKRASAL